MNELFARFKQNETSKKEKSERAKLRNPNRIRDHLANERTFLAWIRTSIALMGIGVVVVRLRILRPPLLPNPGNGWKLGLFFSLIGLVTIWLSTQHYFAVRNDIDDDTYEPCDRWVILFSLMITLLAAGVLYYVFSVSLDPTGLMVPE
ncbi:DUF202 domain-containing protein [Tumidithrix elongata RA019]|uniref:DUF202 domain-containing protein n=1 Tax=Tumidithrix elongata BACA0141 TaxID=2716417 RepID=A0AAW9QAD4_9CYAN|nr:DUF202 domain-containing protein [Tumidithrix elongata RA019]